MFVHINYGYLTKPPHGDLIKYDLNGKNVDTTFGDGGTLTIPPFVNTIVEQPDRKLLIVDSRYGNDPVLLRVNADGTPDTDSGVDG